MTGDWRVMEVQKDGVRQYMVYRVLDTARTDRAANREVKGYTRDELRAWKIADELNGTRRDRNGRIVTTRQESVNMALALPTVAERLKALRKIRGMNKTQLALAAGCSMATISAVEKEVHKPSVQMCEKLAQVLDVNVDDLIGGDALNEYMGKGTAVMELRRLRNWSLRDLAAKAQVSVSYLSMIERGYRPAEPIMARLALALGVNMSALEDSYRDRPKWERGGCHS